METKSVDELLQSLGKWGRWQVQQAIWLSLTYIPLAFQYTSIVFVGYEPEFKCADTNLTDITAAGNGSDLWPDKTCEKAGTYANVSTPCNGQFEFSEPQYISIVSEWNLLCDSSVLVHTSQTCLSIGLVIGNIILPLSDRFGRKRTLVVSHWLMLVVVTSLTFSPNILVFIALRFVTGLLFPAVNITMCLMLLELFPVKQRALVTMVSKFVWAFGIMLLSLVAYLFRVTSWRYFQLCLSAFSILVVAHTLITEESVRWLFAVNRRRDAIAILKRAAKFNNVSFKDKIAPYVDGAEFASILVLSSRTDINSTPGPYFSSTTSISCPSSEKRYDEVSSVNLDELNRESLSIKELRPREHHVTSSEEKQDMLPHTKTMAFSNAKPTLLDLFRHRTLRKNILISTYILTVDAMLYYGLLLMSSSLAGNRFINVLLSGAVEIPAYLVCVYVLERFGRKACMLGFHTLSGGMLVLAIIVNVTEGPDLLVTAFATLGKFGSCGTLIVTFLHNSEIIPTNMRGLGLGFSGCVANTGGVLAPFSSYLIQFGAWIPGTIFVACCCTVCVLLFFLPETKGRSLPQTAEDLDTWKLKKTTHNTHDGKNRFANKCCAPTD